MDTFTRSPFRGAQIGVCMLSARLTTEQMMTTAQELAVPETAFLFGVGDRRFEIRAYDALGQACDPGGTAALAGGHVLFTEGYVGSTGGVALDGPSETFRVERRADHTTLLLPPRRAEPAANELVLTNGADLIVPLADEDAVRSFEPHRISPPHERAVRMIATAPSTSQQRDFVVRTFALGALRGTETTVDGSAYRALGPYWLDRLKAPIVRGEQLHRRGGVVHVEFASDATLAISGQCATTAKGIFIVMP